MIRFDLVAYAQKFIGQKYVWGGDDANDGGFDCSGLVLESLRAFGFWRKNDSNAQSIFLEFVGRSKLLNIDDEIRAGDLLFFGESRQKITHIAIAINSKYMVEAGGGNSVQKTGMVRQRPITWRKDFLCALDFIGVQQ